MEPFKAPYPLGWAMGKVLASYKRELFLARVFAAWKQVVGERLAAISKPYRLHKQVLYVGVGDQRWVMELTYGQGKIIEKYKGLFPRLDIKQLYCKYSPNETFGLEEADSASEAASSGLALRRKPAAQLDIPWRSQDAELASGLDRLYAASEAAEQQRQEGKVFYPQSRVLRRGETTKSRALQNVLESRYPTFGIRSDFLKQKDAFQPFELYS